MGAMFGGNRDISLFRHLNRELMGNIISQECLYYKIKTKETKTNIYGETSDKKQYFQPVLLTCLVERGDRVDDVDEFGVQYSKDIIISLLKDDLLGKGECFNNNYDKGDHFGADLVPKIGDIIFWNGEYFEINSITNNQLFTGKNPQYDFEPNPINPGLNNFGWDLSIILKANYVPMDYTGIKKSRIDG